MRPEGERLERATRVELATSSLGTEEKGSQSVGECREVLKGAELDEGADDPDIRPEASQGVEKSPQARPVNSLVNSVPRRRRVHPPRGKASV